MTFVVRISNKKGMLISGLAAFLVIAIPAFGIEIAWARDLYQPRVTVIGSDRGLSAFVTSGSSRLLIVSGNDPAAFGNALAHARHPGLSRIDLIIAGGEPATSRLAAYAIDRVNPGYVIVAGDDSSLLESGLHVDEATTHPRRIELQGGMTVTLDVASRGAQSESDVWTVVIERGATRIVFVSHPDAIDALPIRGPMAALIIGRGNAHLTTTFPDARLVVADGESISGPDLRSVVGESLGPEALTLRVFAGETSRLDFVEGGLKVSENAQRADTSLAGS
jgi:hypothetical protein